VTYRTTAPETNRSQQKLMLHELAPKVARIHCERRDEAVDVQDSRLPPSDWDHELDNRRLEFIERNLDVALRDFDSSERFIAVLFLGVPGASGEFEVWKRRNSDWETRIARVRTERRKEYEAEKRKILEERAFSIVAGHMADERKQQATEEIQLALRAAMIDPEASVQATSDAGERRQLDRAEIVEAGIDHVRNTLEVRGSLWCNVEVECNGFASEKDTKAAPESEKAEPSLAAERAATDQLRGVGSPRRGGSAQIDDDAHVEKYRQQRIDEPGLTVRAFVLAHDNEIPGANVLAKVRRIQMRVSKAQ
jgi:hypothetical protein